MEERMCEVFEIIIQDRNRLKSFIQSEIALAIDNRNREVVELVKGVITLYPTNYKGTPFMLPVGWSEELEQCVISLITSHKRD